MIIDKVFKSVVLIMMGCMLYFSVYVLLSTMITWFIIPTIVIIKFCKLVSIVLAICGVYQILKGMGY